MNRELKDYLYYLTGKILTYEDKKKILVYFEKLHQENIRLKHKNKRINKAIEYIKQISDIEKNYYPYIDTRNIDIKYLIDILEGSDKE